jgi:hypothetical protein
MAQADFDEAAPSQQNVRPERNSRNSNAATSAVVIKDEPNAANNSFQAINNANLEGTPDHQPDGGSAGQIKPPRGDMSTTSSKKGSAQQSHFASKVVDPSSQAENMDGGLAESSYGTRSRNRTNARPNYSEEQDMDFEFLAPATTTTTTNGRKKGNDLAASIGQGNPDVKRAIESSDNAQNANNAGQIAASGKDNASNSSTGIIPSNSKKRKATAANMQSAAAVQASLPTTNGKKTVSAASSLSALAGRETNLMSFIKSKHSLNKKGELVADDGTKLSVNGKNLSTISPNVAPSRFHAIPRFGHSTYHLQQG